MVNYFVSLKQLKLARMANEDFSALARIGLRLHFGE